MVLKLRFVCMLMAFFLTAFSSAQTSDLQLTLVVADLTPNEGQNIEFKYIVKNLGPNTATNLVVADLLPVGFTYVSDDSGGLYNSGTDTYTYPTLNSGATKNLKIIAYANAGTNGSTLTAIGIATG